MEVTPSHLSFWSCLILSELGYIQDNLFMVAITLSIACYSLYKLYKIHGDTL